MPKKLAALVIGAVLLAMAHGGVYACNHIGPEECKPGWEWMCECGSTIENEADIDINVDADANTGWNSAMNTADGYRLSNSSVQAGSPDSQIIQTGNAASLVELNTFANIHEGGFMPTIRMRRMHMMLPTHTDNEADVEIEVEASADTGHNNTVNMASLRRSWCSSSTAGGDQGIATGLATVSIGTLTQVNYSVMDSMD